MRRGLSTLPEVFPLAKRNQCGVAFSDTALPNTTADGFLARHSSSVVAAVQPAQAIDGE
jgi:hypothetical protein